MSITLEFEGTVSVPATHTCPAVCPVGQEASFRLTLEPIVSSFAAVADGRISFSQSSAWRQVLSLLQFASVQFLALSLVEGNVASVELLLGHPPKLQGAAGVFPVVTPATLAFRLTTFDVQGGTVNHTISVTSQVGDTAQVLANRINSAAMLDGVFGLLASVVGGQVLLTGDQPGAVRALDVTTPAALLGFPTAGVVLGTGAPVSVNRVSVGSFDANTYAGADVWLRGGQADIDYVAAGS